MKTSTSGQSSNFTILTALSAVFPSLVSLLLQNGVPWGGTFQPGDDLTQNLIGETPLALFTSCRHALQPWAEISLPIGWTMLSIGVLYGLLVWCHFGTRERQQKISAFRSVVVPIVTIGLFVFTGCLCVYAHMMLKYAIGFDFYEFPVLMSMRDKFNLQPFNGLRLREDETATQWNKTQITLKCCGLDGYTDWTEIEQDIVPDSCCRIPKPGCGKNLSVENIYQRGCQEKLTQHIKRQYITQTQDEQIFYLIVSIVFFASANVIMFFSVMTCMRNKENSYYLVSDDAREKFVIEIAINHKSLQ